MAAVHRAGLQAQYHEVDDEKLAQQAQDAEPLVLVAGGDGTVERVACALQGRAATLVILPTGGSNNIARAYGALLPPDQVLAGLREATRKRLPLGHVYGANGRQCFLESVGVGVLAHSGIDLPKAPTRDRKREQGREALSEALTDAPAVTCRVSIDGESLTERTLLLEVMNIGIIGPNLPLLPEWRPEDDALTVTWLPEANRQDMIAWLAEPDGREPPMRRRPARRVEFELDGEPLHVADDVLRALDGTVTVERYESALDILVPKARP
jgi:diacylglycerol kinase family enzyme